MLTLILAAVLSQPFQGWPPASPCRIADFNHSGTVDGDDVIDFITAFFDGESLDADLDGDGYVTENDWKAFFRAYDTCTGA